MRAIAPALTGLVLAGCAWGPGTGFASLEHSEVTAAWPLGTGRQDEAGRLKTDNGYRLAVSEGQVRVYLGTVSLLAPAAAGGTGTGATFDPAHPPAGYTLCHSGHCHRTDGALVSYEDVQAQLAGGGGAAAPKQVLGLTPSTAVLFVPVGGEATSNSFFCSTTSCMIDQGTIARADLAVSRVQAYGSAEAGPGLPVLGAAPLEWELDLPTDALSYDARAAATIDRTSPYALGFSGRLAISDRLFDDIEWDRLAQAANGATVHLEADARTKETLLANLAKARWTAEIKRYP